MKLTTLSGNNKPATIVVRVGNNRPDLGTNPICNRFTGILEEGQPLFLPCNPPVIIKLADFQDENTH